jgi:hypothetical protein
MERTSVEHLLSATCPGLKLIDKAEAAGHALEHAAVFAESTFREKVIDRVNRLLQLNDL